MTVPYKGTIRRSLFALGPVLKDVPPPGYEYQCVDRSLLKPMYTRLFVKPIVARLPAHVSANDISLLSQAFALVPAAVTIVALFVAPGWLLGLIAPLGYLGYIVFDNVDGAHARHTSTSSPLGELVDHWCDAWNAALLPAVWGIAWGARPVLACAMGGITGLAYVVAVDEHRETGTLKLDRVGAGEAMTAMMLSMVAMGIFGREAVLRAPLVAGFGVSDGLHVVCTVGSSGAVVASLARRGLGGAVRAAAYIAGAAGVLAWVALGLHPIAGAFILAGLSAVSAGRTVLARTTGLPTSVDATSLLAVGAGLATTQIAPLASVQTFVGVGVGAIVALRACLDFVWGLRALRRWLRRDELLGRLAPWLAQRARRARTETRSTHV